MNKEPDGELAAEQDGGREDQNKVKSAYHSFSFSVAGQLGTSFGRYSWRSFTPARWLIVAAVSLL
jgi:hypothetical protein